MHSLFCVIFAAISSNTNNALFIQLKKKVCVENEEKEPQIAFIHFHII